MKQCVFLASIESDLLIHAGICTLLKELFPDNKNILILPRYSRVYKRADDYKQYFDEVVEVEGIHFTLNPAGIARNFFNIKKIFSVVAPFRGSIFFLFDVYNLVELAVYSFIKKYKEARLVTVTAFEGDEFNLNNLERVIKGSLRNSLYSLILTRKVFFEYRVKNSQNAGLNYFRGDSDLQISINKSKSRNRYKKIIQGMPYPGLFLAKTNNKLFPQYATIKLSSVIVFVESQIAHWTEDYWGKVNRLVEILEERRMTIYVKDHPNCIHSDVDQLQNKNIIVLPKEISAEMLFINNAENISGVFGHGTTSLVTASWMMIPAFDTSRYFGFDENILKKFSDFLTLGDNILTFNSAADAEFIGLPERTAKRSSYQKQKQRWVEDITKELRVLND